MKYNISSFVELLDNNKLSLEDILKIRILLNSPFKIHPLGFYSCTLLHEDNQKIRLHYWDSEINKEQQSPQLMIHDHIFNFKSWIMLGALENIEYEISEDGDIFDLYSTRYEGNLSILENTNKNIKIIKNKINVYTQGMSYLMGAQVLHQTRSLTDKTFTILHTYDTDNNIPRVLSNRGRVESEIVFKRKDIDEQQLISKLEALFY